MLLNVNRTCLATQNECLSHFLVTLLLPPPFPPPLHHSLHPRPPFLLHLLPPLYLAAFLTHSRLSCHHLRAVHSSSRRHFPHISPLPILPSFPILFPYLAGLAVEEARSGHWCTNWEQHLQFYLPPPLIAVCTEAAHLSMRNGWMSWR